MTALRKLVPLLILLLAGCPSVQETKEKRPGSGTVTLSGPEEPMPLLRGGTQRLDVTVNRPAEFAEDVQLQVYVEPAEKGVTAELEPKTVRPGDDRVVKLIVSAERMARAGEYTVTVRGFAGKTRTPPLSVVLRIAPLP